MTGASDTVEVAGSALFEGGSHDGLLTDGILEIRVPIEAATAESRSIPIARGASD